MPDTANWGGAREGAGRKKISKSGRKQIQFSLQQSEVDTLKQAAKERSMPVSRFVMECVNAFLAKDK